MALHGWRGNGPSGGFYGAAIRERSGTRRFMGSGCRRVVVWLAWGGWGHGRRHAEARRRHMWRHGGGMKPSYGSRSEASEASFPSHGPLTCACACARKGDLI